MRSLVTGLTLLTLVTAAVASTEPADLSGTLAQKLEQIRGMRTAKNTARRVVVLPFTNETPVTGAENGMDEYLRNQFVSYSTYYKVLSAEETKAAVGSHAANAPWTPAELAQVAQTLQADTILFASVKEFRCKKGFGLPLPYMWIKNKADVTLAASIYKAPANAVTWTDTLHKRGKDYFMAALRSRSKTRGDTGSAVLDQFFGAFLQSEASALK